MGNKGKTSYSEEVREQLNVGDHGGKVVSMYVKRGTIKEKLWEIETQGDFGRERGKKDPLLPAIHRYLLCYYSRIFHIASCKHRVNNNCSWQE